MSSEYADQILEFVQHTGYHPVKTKELARKLDVPEIHYAAFRNAVRRLIRQGRLEYAAKRTLRATAARDLVTGFFKSTARGFGFVRPRHGEGAEVSPDIFIDATDAADAASGDEVLVRLERQRVGPGRSPTGRIIQVIERASEQFVGTYFEDEGQGYVRVDGTVFQWPIDVGDPGAKGVRPDDKVVFEMIRFPTADMPGEGVITEILGPRGAPGVDTRSIIREFHLPDAFPDDALDEARAAARTFDASDLHGRADLTAQTIVTIDPATARDFDDAISLDRDDRGHWHLGVHIADVSHFVQPGTALDREAAKRGTSVYLPDVVLPMLPETISNSLASLQEGKVRYTKSVWLEFDPDGVPLDARFADSAIRVTQRFTYEQVTAWLQGLDAELPRVSAEVRALIHRMRDLAMILRRRRRDRGALELTMPEVALDFDDQGRVVAAHYVPHDVSHQIIEEFMLAANEAVAQELRDRDVPFLHRVHGDPDPRKLKLFAEFVHTLGFDLTQYRSRFALQALLDRVEDRPERQAVNYALLRSMKQAIYSPDDEGHYALASPSYCHFTSPIRRYPDLTVHRTLGKLLRGRSTGADAAGLIALGEHCSFTERRAEQAERELVRVKLLDFMSSRIGAEFMAIITGVEEFGFFAQIEDLPAEGLVHVSTLGDDYYYFDPASHSLIARRRGTRYRLGDRIKVRVVRVDQDRRQLDFRIVPRKRTVSSE